MLRVPGTGFFSSTFGSGFAGWVTGVGGAVFSLSTIFSAAFFPPVLALLAVAFGRTAGATTGVRFGELRAGKSSSWSTFCDLAFAISLDRPLSTARALMFFLASDPDGTTAFFPVNGLDGATDLPGAIGNATGGVCRPWLCASIEAWEITGEGWLSGRPRPGGTEGVPERPKDSNVPGGWRILTLVGSSATRLSTFVVASSRERRSSSTKQLASWTGKSGCWCKDVCCAVRGTRDQGPLGRKGIPRQEWTFLYT